MGRGLLVPGPPGSGPSAPLRAACPRSACSRRRLRRAPRARPPFIPPPPRPIRAPRRPLRPIGGRPPRARAGQWRGGGAGSKARPAERALKAATPGGAWGWAHTGHKPRRRRRKKKKNKKKKKKKQQQLSPMSNGDNLPFAKHSSPTGPCCHPRCTRARSGSAGAQRSPGGNLGQNKQNVSWKKNKIKIKKERTSLVLCRTKVSLPASNVLWCWRRNWCWLGRGKRAFGCFKENVPKFWPGTQQNPSRDG